MIYYWNVHAFNLLVSLHFQWCWASLRRLLLHHWRTGGDPPQPRSPLSEVPWQSSDGARQASEDFPRTIFEFPTLLPCLFPFGGLPPMVLRKPPNRKRKGKRMGNSKTVLGKSSEACLAPRTAEGTSKSGDCGCGEPPQVL